ncbi:MAG: YggS family pyridoxal phosphate-dependent enzyme [Actinomycetota bacterium]
MPDSVSERVREARQRIAAACARVNRKADAITLVGAVKGVPPDVIVQSGIRDAGENRAQDLLAKQEALKDHDLIWHFIGALQGNKVRKIVGRVRLIHSIDSIELVESVSRAACDGSITQSILIEVNTSGESSKAGCDPTELPALIARARELDGVDVRGLMTIPKSSDIEQARRSFRTLAGLARSNSLPELSMGMSADFEVAIEEGATIIRLGTALYGPRKA